VTSVSSDEYVTTEIGTYRWVVSYSGDGSHTAGVSGCQEEPVRIVAVAGVKLARTGSNPLGGIPAGFAFLGIGLAILVTTRRREAVRPELVAEEHLECRRPSSPPGERAVP
jgi:hypothetical protein